MSGRNAPPPVPAGKARSGKPAVAILMSDRTSLPWTDRAHLLEDRLIDELRAEFDLRIDLDRDSADSDRAMELLTDADACIIGWGSPPFIDEMIRSAPKLRFIGYAGGSVKAYICDEIVARDITVCAADIVNAENVSQTAVGIILSGIRGLFPRYLESRGESDYRRFPTRGISGKTVGVAGAGLIGRNVISMLCGFDVTILLYDPYVTEAEAEALGCTRVPLDRLDGSRMFAYLDILDPDQPDVLTPLPNVAYSPAVAGCIRDTQYRMGRFVVDQLRRFFGGKPVINRFDFSKRSIRA